MYTIVKNELRGTSTDVDSCYVEIVCDTVSDLPAVDENWAVGSKCYILVGGGMTYMLSNAREWVSVNFDVGGGGQGAILSEYEQLDFIFNQTGSEEYHAGYKTPTEWVMLSAYEALITNKCGDVLYSCTITVDSQNNMETVWTNDIACPHINIIGTSWGQTSYCDILFRVLDDSTLDIFLLAQTTPQASNVTGYRPYIKLEEIAKIMNIISKYNVYIKRLS